MGILATYKTYRENNKYYNDWHEQQDAERNKRQTLASNPDITSFYDTKLAQEQAKIAANSMLILDDYTHSKAEDVEAIFQTLNIELLAGLTFSSALPKGAGKLINLIESNKKLSEPLSGILNNLKKYNNKTVKIGKEIPLSSLLSGVFALISTAIYIPTVTNFVKNQLGATRRAKFEGMDVELPDVKDFVVPTQEQQNQINSVLNEKSGQDESEPGEKKKVSKIVKDLFDRVNIAKSFENVGKLLQDKSKYDLEKERYDKSISSSAKHFDEPIPDQTKKDAMADRQTFQDIIKEVDLKSLDELERMEKVVNVGYGSLFACGFIEFLISDKFIAKAVKNPVLQKVTSGAICLLTYLVLNKNLAKFQNDAIKAIRYKNLKEYTDNEDNFKFYTAEQINSVSDDKNKNQPKEKKGLLSFINGIRKDIKDYNKFKDSEFDKLKQCNEAKRSIGYSQEQLEEAKTLQRNTFMTVNKVADNNQNLAESIEALSEIALAPVEIATTALGGVIGKNIAGKIGSKKHETLLMGIGALIAFIPCALVEIYTTAKQKQALRISSMLSMKELDDYKNFVDYDDKTYKQQITSILPFSSGMPSVFVAFQQKKDEN